MSRKPGNEFGYAGGRSGAAASYLTDSGIAEIQRIAACVVIKDDSPSRCAKPGEPPLNREQRCKHGFVDNGAMCIDCQGSKRNRRRQKSKRERQSERIAILRIIASGVNSKAELSEKIGCSAYQLAAKITWLRRYGYLSDDLELRLTLLGEDEANR